LTPNYGVVDMKKICKIFLAVYTIYFFSINFANAEAVKSASSAIPASQLQRLSNIITSIHQYYIQPVTDEQLFDNAIEGVLNGLDPHSSYLDKEDLKSLKIITSGEFDGIGITVIPEFGALRVISPIDGSPAQKAGINAGDIIIRIDNKLTKDISEAKAITMIRGEKGSKITLYIIRKEQPKPLKFTITRDTIKVPIVREKLLENHYGYIRIGIFYKTTHEDLIKAIEQLQQQSKKQLRGIILDLRDNPGGLLEPSVKVADDFLDSRKLTTNKLIIYTIGYPNSKRVNYYATDGELLPKMPIVVLINSGSSSAAEIVAGALQDHNRAIILGTKSFGKGSVQTVFPIDKDSAIKITTSLYYTPGGRSIQALGITPDVMVNTLKITKEYIKTSPFEPIYEADLLNDDKNQDVNETAFSQIKNESNLMQNDFQIYQALNILKALSALRK
jgi:carboxyl-terminal processing protease